MEQHRLFSSGKIILTITFEENMNAESEEHCHSQSEIIFVTEGRGRMMMGDGSVDTAAEGDVFYFDSMQKHRLVAVDPRIPFSAFSLKFDIHSFMTEDVKVFSKESLSAFFNLVSTKGVKFTGESDTLAKIRNEIYVMTDDFGADEASESFVIRARVLVLLALIMEEALRGSEVPEVKRTGRYAEIEKTMIYISEHLGEDITLEELAKLANMNKTYYSTVFKKVVGMTVWEYITNARIEYAVSVLAKNGADASITEVLLASGFNNAAAFNKAFKRITGKTPSEFRKTEYNSCFSKDN